MLSRPFLKPRSSCSHTRRTYAISASDQTQEELGMPSPSQTSFNFVESPRLKASAYLLHGSSVNRLWWLFNT